MRMILTGVVVLALAGVGSCSREAGPKEGLGTLGGAVVGGIVGSQVGGGTGRLVATGAGAALGALAGGEIGRSLDRADQQYLQNATTSALETSPSGHEVEWRNPDSGNYGSITPSPAYQDESGGYCREFQQTITVAGEAESAYGTACRQPDGSWKIVG